MSTTTKYKRIPRSTPKRNAQLRRYRSVKEAFLTSHDQCFRCGDDIEFRERELHHFYGRTGELLCWVPGFRMVDRFCHTVIETNRNDAVKNGWRAPNNIFGRPSKVIPR